MVAKRVVVAGGDSAGLTSALDLQHVPGTDVDDRDSGMACRRLR